MSDHSRTNRWPAAVSGVGGLLGVVLVGEWPIVTTSARPVPEGVTVGVLSSAPFVLWPAYRGYWVATSDLSVERYARIEAWTVGGLGAFLITNVAIMATVPPADSLESVG